MNEIRRIESEADEIARVRAVMDRFPLPEFVVGYTVTLGAFDDEPSLWLRFATTHRLPNSGEQRRAIGRELNQLGKDAFAHLREHYPERYPYFRFGDPDPTVSQA